MLSVGNGRNSLAREVVVQTLRHIAERRGVNFGAVISGKIKMFLQSFGVEIG